jgi:hypothetical protein
MNDATLQTDLIPDPPKPDDVRESRGRAAVIRGTMSFH